MGDVAVAVARGECHGNAPDADGGIAAGRGKYIVQALLDLRIARADPAADGVQEISVLDHRLACLVGVDNAPARIHEKHPGAQAVERIGQCRRLRGSKLDGLAHQHRPAHVRKDLPQARRISSSTMPSASFRTTLAASIHP